MKKEQARTAKVLVALMASMTVGGIVLMTLDDHAPAQGAYSLASYLRLDPIEEVTLNPIIAKKAVWSDVEVFYSQSAEGNLASLAKQGKGGFHFVVCNGKGDEDGQIETTSNWTNQKTVAGDRGVIRICVIADRTQSPITASQLVRTVALVDSLSRSFNIDSRKVRYPSDWQM